jgi:hypothetical protein
VGVVVGPRPPGCLNKQKKKKKKKKKAYVLQWKV